MDSKTKSSIKSRLTSLLTAGAIYATSLPYFQSGIGENLSVVVFVWTWLAILLGFVAVIMLGTAAGILIWTVDNLTWNDDRGKIEKASEGLVDIKPKWYWTLPLTATWIYALASAGWTGTLGTYVVLSVVSWIVIYGIIGALRKVVDKLKIDQEDKAADN